MTKVLRYDQDSGAVMAPRYGGRPNKDRVMTSFYIDRADKEAAEASVQEGETLADVWRDVVKSGLRARERRAKRAQN